LKSPDAELDALIRGLYEAGDRVAETLEKERATKFLESLEKLVHDCVLPKEEALEEKSKETPEEKETPHVSEAEPAREVEETSGQNGEATGEVSPPPEDLPEPPLEPLPKEPEFDAAVLARDKFKELTVSQGEDEEKHRGHMTLVRTWCSRLDSLQTGMGAAISVSDQIIERLAEPEGHVERTSEALSSRYDSLQLIRRMLARLKDRLTQLEPGTFSAVEFANDVTFTSLHEHASIGGVRSGPQLVEQMLTDAADQRHAAIVATRRAWELARKRHNDFVEKQVLPVIDALDDGEKYTRELIDEAPDAYADTLLKTYEAARKPLLIALSDVAVTPMKVELHAPVDFDRHEPFDVEPDPDYPNETVKEVFRKGYELVAEENLVIRPAQVIVVKNAVAQGAAEEGE
jgi:molecular chaperone GrpE (heat shock protein)